MNITSIIKKLLQKLYENNLDKRKIISQLRRYHIRGYINTELLSMLLGVFKVQETRVKDIMIPRSKMVIIKKNSSISSSSNETSENNRTLTKAAS